MRRHGLWLLMGFLAGCGGQENDFDPLQRGGLNGEPGMQPAGEALPGVIDTTIPSTGPVPTGCKRIEGGAIGQANLLLDVDGIELEFTGWTAKQGEGEVVGFGYVTTGGNVAYAVKAGGETHYGASSPWLHPGGTSGPNAPGISNITFCPTKPTTDGGITEGGPGGSSGSSGTDGGITEGGPGGSSGSSGTDGGITEGGPGGSSGSSGTDGGITEGDGNSTPSSGGSDTDAGSTNVPAGDPSGLG